MSNYSKVIRLFRASDSISSVDPGSTCFDSAHEKLTVSEAKNPSIHTILSGDIVKGMVSKEYDRVSHMKNICHPIVGLTHSNRSSPCGDPDLSNESLVPKTSPAVAYASFVMQPSSLQCLCQCT